MSKLTTVEQLESRKCFDGSEDLRDPEDYFVGRDDAFLDSAPFENIGSVPRTVGSIHAMASNFRSRDANVGSDYYRLFSKMFEKIISIPATMRDELWWTLGDDSWTDLHGSRLSIYLSAQSSNLSASASTQSRLKISDGRRQVFNALRKNVRTIELFAGPTATNGFNNEIRIAKSFPEAAIYLGAGNDRLYANDQSSTIYGGSGDDTIYAGGGDDVVYGDEGTDRLFGEGGNDTLFGGAHKDFLNGGSGKNILVGGSGTDYFTVRPKDKTDREPRDHVTVLS